MTPEQFDAICEQIRIGKGLQVAAKENGTTDTTFNRHCDKDPELALKYARAREAQAELFADQMVEIADNPEIPADQKRCMMDARKWSAGKIAPRKYGDRVTNEHVGKDGGPIKTEGSLDVTGLSRAQIEALASIKVSEE